MFTDLHDDYHRTTDDWQKIDAEGFRRVTNFTIGLVTALANRPATLHAGRRPTPPAARATAIPAYGTYLGTIPDMTDNPGGVRLARRPGR